MLKKILLAACLVTSSFLVVAGPVEELQAAIKAEQAKVANLDRAQPQGYSQSVLRTYMATKGGLLAVNNGETYLGSYISRDALRSALATMGFFLLAWQGYMDIYAAGPGTQYVGFTILAWNDTRGYSSEIYLTNTYLP